jgi:L-tryptophan--pyruvate aminotransferase
MMYEAFWREVGGRAATVIRGCQAMSYVSDDAALCWFLEPELEREVRRLHRVVGNAVADGYHLVVGTGATQLYQAAMYALSSPAQGDKPVPVVSPAPYYSVRSLKPES